MFGFRSLVRRYSRLLNQPPPLARKGQPLKTDEIGALGERIAARYLYAQGCKLLFRNFRAPAGGEIDVVCRQQKLLLFVEVKTRTSDEFGRPADAVNLEKQELISRGVRAWLRLLDDAPIPFRCDIVEVLLLPDQAPAVNWIQGAFRIEDLSKKRSFS